MIHLGYLLVGWGVSFGCGALYATRLLLRGRALSARVPAAQRRWMTSNDKVGLIASSATANEEVGP